MGEAENRRLVERLIDGLNAGDVDVMNDVMSDDSVLTYPQSGEVIKGRDNRQAIYHARPTLPTIEPLRTIASGDIVVAEANLDYGDDRFQTVFVFVCRDGRIVSETVYWAKPFPAAEWRSRWVEKG
jgi:ketosteroid isomerase-like protein